MTLHLVTRPLGPMPWEERENLIMNAILAFSSYPDVAWLRSYEAEDQALCIYEADTPERIAAHSNSCHVPLSAVRPIVEYLPEGRVAPGMNVAAEGSKLFAISRVDPGWADADHLEAAVFRSANCIAAVPGLRWERSFYDAERTHSWCIYRAPDEEAIRGHARMSRVPCDLILPVDEVRADAYAGIYRSFGLQTPVVA